MIYEPREDSYLLAKHVKKHAFGRVLDVGTGSGIQAVTAAKLKKVSSVLGVDIQKSAVDYCRKTVKGKERQKIKFRQSDLFKDMSGKFDTIIFNPPYLPEDARLKDITLEGGKKGYEVIERFFDNVSGFLRPNGIILVVFSSLTKKDRVDEMILDNLMEFMELEKEKFFFEELYIYLVKKTNILKKLEKKGIKKVKRLTKGHRGLIFTGDMGKKRIAVKVQRKDIGAEGTVNKEYRFLKALNKKNVGPKVLFSGDNLFAYEYVEGAFIPEFLEKASKKDIKKILKDVFSQCYKLDLLKMNKEEMHHPYKHVVVSKKGNKLHAVLLDFERANKTKKPHNVTQFCQYVTSGKFNSLAKKKAKIDKKRMIELAKEYKSDTSRKNFNAILNEIK